MDAVLILGIAAAAAGPVILWTGWRQGGKARPWRAVRGWAPILAGLILLGWRDGAWGLMVGAMAAMFAACLILAWVVLGSQADKGRAPREAPSAPRGWLGWSDLGRRVSVFLLVVPGSMIASGLVALALQAGARRMGWLEANSTTFGLLVFPFAWILFALFLTLRTGPVAMAQARPRPCHSGFWHRRGTMAGFPSADLVKRALSGHAAIGLLAGAFLYLICLSGTLIVVHEEWQRWEQPDIAEMARIDPAAVQKAAETVLASEASQTPTGHFYVHMPNEALPRAVITTDHQAVYVDETGNIAGPEAHGWTEFMIGLHYYLHLPTTLGLTVVGAFGVMLAALALGGVLAHPRIFRDAFRLRAKGSARVAQTDWHNRLGVWTLPFSLSVAITGAWLGLASILAFVMATVFYDGDREKVFSPIFGGEPAHDARPAPLADMEGALRHMAQAHPGITPTYVILHDPGTAGQFLQIMGDHPRRLIFGEYYQFDAEGRFTGTVGMADGEIGQQLAGSTYKLHFGSFGGLPVKLAYILFGLAVTVVSATGTSIWLMKRRQRGAPAPRLEAMWATLLWGAPILIAGSYLLRTGMGPEAPMVAFFWTGLAFLWFAAAAYPDAQRWSLMLRTLLAMLLLTIGAVHGALQESFRPGILAIDFVLLAGGALWLARLAPSIRDERRRELVPAG